MIVRIHFDGIVKSGKKRSILPDHVDIHATDLDSGKSRFIGWLSQAGMRGSSGVFHPIGDEAQIKIKKVEEYVA